MVKNTIPGYEDPKERDMLLKKQYQQLQRRFYEEKRKTVKMVQADERGK